MSADDHAARQQVMRSEAFKAQDPKAYEELMHIGFSYLFADRNRLKDLHLDLPEDYAAKSKMLGYLFADFTDYNYVEELKSLTTPTLIISGLKDPGAPLALSSLSAAIPAAMLRGVDDAGHFPFIEQPQQFAEEVIAFLSK